MRQFSFKIFEDEDPDVIARLDALTRRRRSEEIRKALRSYFRREVCKEFAKNIFEKV